jgi:hypothetical protein
MTPRSRLVGFTLSTVLVGGAVGGVLALGPLARDEAASNGAGAGSGPPDAPVRGCRERVEGVARITPVAQRDTIIGPIAFIGLPVTYRDFAARADEELKEDPRVGMPVMKSIAWVRANARVTVVVPREQRAWNRLAYERPSRRGVPALTFRACRKLRSRRAQRRECGWPRPWKSYKACRRPYTEFNGGVAIDFAAAPQRGSCATVIVRVEGREKPLREHLFRPKPEECGDSPE